MTGDPDPLAQAFPLFCSSVEHLIPHYDTESETIGLRDNISRTDLTLVVTGVQRLCARTRNGAIPG